MMLSSVYYRFIGKAIFVTQRCIYPVLTRNHTFGEILRTFFRLPH